MKCSALSPTRIVVIETDGAIELADNLKVAYHGAAMTGLQVTRQPLGRGAAAAGRGGPPAGRALTLPAMPRLRYPPRLRRRPLRAPVSSRHRFYNPSVYCPDLIKLIGHIRKTMRADIDVRRGKRVSG